MTVGDLLDRSGLAGVDGDAQPLAATAPEERPVVGRVEAVQFGPRDVNADHAAFTIRDGLLGDDLVELDGEGAVQAEDETGLHGVFQHRAVHAPDGRADDVVEVLLTAPVALHGVEAQLHGGDVVLAVGAADDLVGSPLDGQR